MGITAADIINQSASKIGVGGRGKTLAPDELMDWLKGLKQMIEGWALERLMIPYRTRETLPLSKQQSFSIGPGGDFDTERPLEIHLLQISDAAGNTYPLTQVPLNSWAMSEHDVVARPCKFYYENGYPLARIFFDTIPDDPTLIMVSSKPIETWLITDLDIAGNPAFAGQTTPTSSLSVDTLQADIEFDRGYESAIIFNLAVYMAADYGEVPTNLVLGLAEQYKTRIKNQNITIPSMTAEPGLMGGDRGYYDINKGPGE